MHCEWGRLNIEQADRWAVGWNEGKDGRREKVGGGKRWEEGKGGRRGKVGGGKRQEGKR